MALILNIETATTNCSVSLSKDGETFVLKEDNDKNYSHAERLHTYIEDILKENNLQPEHLDAVAVSKGPGSYTGLRIGVSSAKGLCYALNKPLVAVSTLEALAHQVNCKDGVIVAMLDARRMEVYSAVFSTGFDAVRGIQAEVLTENSFIEFLEQGKVYFVGNGVEKSKTVIQHPNAVFIADKLPSAREMGTIAELKYKKNDIEDVAYFEPYYLKDFVALKPKSK